MSVRVVRPLLIAMALSVFVPALIARAPGGSTACLVTTRTGDVEGIDGGSTCTFLGIPYAAPPTGTRRWKPPQPAAPWISPLPVKTPPASCPNLNTGSPGGNEDCLKLNIWAKNPQPLSGAPVIVWLHTGSFLAASANFASHNGLRLAAETGVVVVAPNYRLGPLGFLSHQALADEDPNHPVSGNYGLLDQRWVLQWVRDNIAAFGGDPNNVTLAGTSAGADSTGLHLISPGSAGLFHRAVIESGTPTIRWPTQAEANVQGHAFATALGCVNPATVASCLRSKTVAQILTALPVGSQQVLEQSGRVFWVPVVDGLELPDQPRALFNAGQFSAVPTILGFNRDEGAGAFISRSFGSGVTLAQYQSWVTTEFGPDAPAVLQQYPAASYPSPADAMAQVVGDGQFACEARRLARSISDAHAPAFLYSYEYEVDDVFPDRVIHGVESNILFGNNYVPNQFPNHVLNSADLALHDLMAGYWTRFAASGDPDGGPSIPRWPRFTDSHGEGRSSNKFIVLDVKSTDSKRPREQACDFWEPYFLRSMLGQVPAR